MALRKRRFCAAKQPLLPCKTYAFGTQNNRFYNALIIRELYNRYAYEKYLHFCRFFSLNTHSLSAELSLVIITPPTPPYRHSKFGQTWHIYHQ
ncbi:hypothetical protein CTM55_11760 [Prevotella intermedia]|nr:hypothetical protein CTM55_11760 [Prevotella intermedia]